MPYKRSAMHLGLSNIVLVPKLVFEELGSTVTISFVKRHSLPVGMNAVTGDSTAGGGLSQPHLMMQV